MAWPRFPRASPVSPLTPRARASFKPASGPHSRNAAFWARQIAEGGLIGIVMCNSHPSKAPPGGVERLTGANSLAIALPSTDAQPFVVDLDVGGVPSDPAAAIAAMLV